MKIIVMSGLLATVAVTALVAVPHRADAYTDPDLGQRPIAIEARSAGGRTLVTANMLPGDAHTAAMAVENRGAAELRYAITGSSTNPDGKELRSALTLAVRSADLGGRTGFADDGDHCDDATGAVLRAASPLGAGANLVGDPGQGAQPGDRTLASGASEVLCFTLELPISTGNAYQVASTTTSLTFVAEQTANNP